MLRGKEDEGRAGAISTHAVVCPLDNSYVRRTSEDDLLHFHHFEIFLKMGSKYTFSNGKAPKYVESPLNRGATLETNPKALKCACGTSAVSATLEHFGKVESIGRYVRSIFHSQISNHQASLAMGFTRSTS